MKKHRICALLYSALLSLSFIKQIQAEEYMICKGGGHEFSITNFPKRMITPFKGMIRSTRTNRELVSSLDEVPKGESPNAIVLIKGFNEDGDWSLERVGNIEANDKVYFNVYSKILKKKINYSTIWDFTGEFEGYYGPYGDAHLKGGVACTEWISCDENSGPCILS